MRKELNVKNMELAKLRLEKGITSYPGISSTIIKKNKLIKLLNNGLTTEEAIIFQQEIAKVATMTQNEIKNAKSN
jgi:hypothetical protein